MPNFDINIKIGNSLVKKSGLKQELSPFIGVLKTYGITIETYKGLVSRYKTAHDRKEKEEIKEKSTSLKKNLEIVFKLRIPSMLKLSNLC